MNFRKVFYIRSSSLVRLGVHTLNWDDFLFDPLVRKIIHEQGAADSAIFSPTSIPKELMSLEITSLVLVAPSQPNSYVS